MKVSDITKAIEANPQTVFTHTTHNTCFIIEGFTFKEKSKYSNTAPTKVAITRSVYITINDDNEGTITISNTTSPMTMTQIGWNRWVSPEEMCTSRVNDHIRCQVVKAKHDEVLVTANSLHDDFISVFADHDISNTRGTISTDSNGHLVFRLTIEQAQALLDQIKA